MSVELYIDAIHDPLVEQYWQLYEAASKHWHNLPATSREAATVEQEVIKYHSLLYGDGYFQDTYSKNSVLFPLGLSWWCDVQPLCGKDQRLPGDQLRHFRDMVAKAELKLPLHGDDLAGRRKYLTGKRAALLAFLDKAIALNSAVHCSM